MTLLQGIRNTNYIYSRNLHHGLMFWLDEGLVEQGFYVDVRRPHYAGQTDLSILTATDASQEYKFAYDRLIWQTSVFATFQTLTRISGVYIGSDFYANDGASYTIDYHNGYINFSSFVDVDDTVTADYYAKQVYVAYQNDDAITAMIDYISANWDTDLNIETLDYKLPILVGGFTNRSVEGYELGGTKEYVLDYRLILFSDSQEIRDSVSDIIMKQEGVAPPTRIWVDMYDDNGILLYNTTDEYLTACDGWRAFWVENINELRFERMGVWVSEFSLDVRVVGTN